MKKRKDGRYQKSISINGKRVVFYGKTTSEINEKMLDYKLKMKDGIVFDDLVEEWENYYITTNHETTYKKCGKAIVKRIKERFSGKRIKNIRPANIDAFLKSLALLHSGKGKSTMSAKSVAMHKCFLNQIFDYAIINNYISTNPVTYVAIPKNLPHNQRKMPKTEDIKKVEENHEGFGFLAYFLLYTGMRISEALAITYEDIDFENKRIAVNKKVIHDGNTPILVNETKTESGTRNIILLNRLERELNKNAKGVVFCNTDGSYYTKSQMRKRWEKYTKKIGVSLTPHQLRHAYATMLFEAGINEKDAQELMGHSDITLTRSIYTHIRSERKKETEDKLNNFNF